MDIERRLAPVVVLVDHPHLSAVPGITVARTDNPPLTGRRHGLELSAEGKVDQLDVVHGDVGPRVSTGNPLRKLRTGNLLGFQQ